MAKLKLTDQLCDEICNDIKAGVPIKHASIAHGISESTFYNWFDKGKEAKSGKFKKFYDKIQEAKSVAITLRARRIYKAGETNWQADAWWLERVAPQEFGRKDRHKLDMNAEIKSENLNVEVKSTEEVLKEHEDTISRFISRRLKKTD